MPCSTQWGSWAVTSVRKYFLHLTEVRVLHYIWNMTCVFGVPKFSPLYVPSTKQSNQLGENEHSELNFVLAEYTSSKNECALFHCILTAFIATQNCIVWYLLTAAANYIRFLHRWYQNSISDWSDVCLMFTDDKNVKRDTNAFVALSDSYLYDKSEDAL